MSTSKHALETVYFAISGGVGGGIGDGLHPSLRKSVTALVAACQKQKLRIFWEEDFEEGDTFREIVPAWFIKHAEACREVLLGS